MSLDAQGNSEAKMSLSQSRAYGDASQTALHGSASGCSTDVVSSARFRAILQRKIEALVVSRGSVWSEQKVDWKRVMVL